MRKWFDEKFIGNSSSARQGAFSFLASFTLFLFPLAFSLWAISVSLEGGKIMLPTSVGSLIFAGIAVISFFLWIGFAVFTIAMVRYWFKHPLADKVSDKVDELSGKIDDLINESKSDRGKREKDGK